MRNKILCLAPTLGPDVIATAKILEAVGLLALLVTRGTATTTLARLLARWAITKSFSRRPHSPVRRELIEAKWTADIAFYLALALTRSNTRAADLSFALLDFFAEKRVNSSIGAVLAREDCCVRAFRRAKQEGAKAIYQLPTAYWRMVRALMERETQEFPGVCLAPDRQEFANYRTERKDVELELADYVLCPSTFVQTSLQNYTIGKTECIPFGISKASSVANRDSRKQMFLYAGNITVRKGVHRILLAWKQLKAYRTHELRLVGDMFLPSRFMSDFSGMYTHVPRVGREELNRHYGEASVFVFNPMADGFGHVILEAMRSAVPVIASKNCGGPDTISDRTEGLLIDYGDQDQLTAALDWALSHPAECREMGQRAAERVGKRTWENYGNRLLDWLRPILD